MAHEWTEDELGRLVAMIDSGFYHGADAEFATELHDLVDAIGGCPTSDALTAELEALKSQASVFQVEDHSNDEVYHTLGTFRTLDAARKALATVTDPTELCLEEVEDYARIEVREYPFGWHDHGRRVYAVELLTHYNDDDGTTTWTRSEVSP